MFQFSSKSFHSLTFHHFTRQRVPQPRASRTVVAIVDKWLDASGYHLVWRWASAQATLFYMETQLPSPKRGTAPKFWLVYRGQTPGWIKMPLGTEVGLGPGDIVLDGDLAPSKRATAPCPQIFSPCLLWPNSWMN